MQGAPRLPIVMIITLSSLPEMQQPWTRYTAKPRESTSFCSGSWTMSDLDEAWGTMPHVMIKPASGQVDVDIFCSTEFPNCVDERLVEGPLPRVPERPGAGLRTAVGVG